MHTFLRCHLKTKGGLRSYVDILDIHRKKIFREIVKTHVYIVPAIFRKFWKYVIISLTSLAKDTWFLLGGATNILWDPKITILRVQGLCSILKNETLDLNKCPLILYQLLEYLLRFLYCYCELLEATLGPLGG